MNLVMICRENSEHVVNILVLHSSGFLLDLNPIPAGYQDLCMISTPYFL